MAFTVESLTYFLGAAILLVFILHSLKKKRRKLAPGPLGWPIIGNLLQLGDRPHQSLFLLAQKYGPLMTLKLGSRTVLVVSSPSMARQVLKNNEENFSNRTVTKAVERIAYQGTTLVWSPYGPRWRFLRKICNAEMFSAKRVDAVEHLRRELVLTTMESIYEESKQGKAVDIRAKAFMISISLVGNMVCGRDVLQPGSKEAMEFKDMVCQVFDVFSTPNLADLFPFLKRFDLQGLNAKIQSLAHSFDCMLHQLIEDRLAMNSSSDVQSNDFLEVLLNLQNRDTDFTLQDVKGLLSDMFIAGAETTPGAIEWVMTELLRNPQTMKRVQHELDEVVGEGRRMEEADIAKLPYLQAVVKETFRLHPPLPFLERRAAKECEIGGYVVPANTQVLVNVWGIGRDAKVWESPLEFSPDRFMDSDIDYRGQYFEMLAFGSGRRMCAGLPLAHKTVHLVVGSLLQSFDWSSSDIVIDMTDKFGTTLHKALPLMPVPTPRAAMKTLS
uniref:TSA: Wollemia nobilis Ref_Wollemi_Transcript_19814_1720 transcribed RNA sequence n=1 Tax=Wollemia nobilis TaxID=56998 RepID=A0A0C9RRB5_9CONI